MKLDILISAMHLNGYQELLKKLKIRGNCVLVNQCDREAVQTIYEEVIPDPASGCSKPEVRRIQYIETTERGLSRSRNMALSYSEGEICALCDDDVRYVDHYESRILQSYEEHPEADVIVFFVKGEEKPSPYYEKPRYLHSVTSMKAGSPEITFRRKSLDGIHFPELFGAGSRFSMGEESILLYACLKRGLKILYLPLQIAELLPSQSTWFRGYTDTFFRDKGAAFAAMGATRGIWPSLLELQFLLRKYSRYEQENTLQNAWKQMRLGQREYEKLRIFLIGDSHSLNGPGKVTRQLLWHLPADTLYVKSRGRTGQALEILWKSRKAGIVLCSGLSRQCLLGIRAASRRGRKSAYVMHGCVAYESEINEGKRICDSMQRSTANESETSEGKRVCDLVQSGTVNESETSEGKRVCDSVQSGTANESETSEQKKSRKALLEEAILKEADCILAVSQSFCNWVKAQYPPYAGKTACAPNGVELEKWWQESGTDLGDRKRESERAEESGYGKSKRTSQILSLGGGVPEKNMLPLCRAVESWNRKHEGQVRLLIAGANGRDTEEIRRYDCVEYLGSLPHEQVLGLLQESQIYVQNSYLETFGLAVLEAVLQGCDCLISQNVGALSELAYEEDDVIWDVEDVEEIERKLGLLLEGRKNNQRLRDSLDLRKLSAGQRTLELQRTLWKVLKI